MGVLLVVLVAMPAATTLACIVVPRRVAAALTVITGVAAFAFAVALVAPATHHTLTAARYLRADALSVVFVLGTAFVYMTTAMYAIGYQAAEAASVAAGHEDRVIFARYSRRLYIGLNAFAWSMVCAPLVNGLALLWIAVEITTVISALLVALDDTEGATEAAWKYVLIASSGLGIGLLATIFMYYAGSSVLGESYDLAFDPLLAGAASLPRTAVQLAFVLAVVGYGTKVGLFPVHTWLPDAHAEAPTPVSALLSGSLLAVSLYAILRFYQIAIIPLGTRFPQLVLLVFGVASLALAALYLLEQRDIKRLLAYSSIEHMGILTIGISFGVPLALTGVLLHVLAHAAAKGNAFMGAGVMVRKYGTKELASIRGALTRLPWSAPLFLLAVFALAAMPPFGLFRSEFLIISSGLADHRNAATVALVCLVTVAFAGLTAATTWMLFAPAPADGPGAATADVLERGEPSAWMVTPVVIGVAALLLLGLAPPGDLIDLLTRGAAELTGAAR
jgi:hydrogenase-4 component F